MLESDGLRQCDLEMIEVQRERPVMEKQTNKQTGSTSLALFKVGQGTGGNVSSAELEMGARLSLCLTSLLSPM